MPLRAASWEMERDNFTLGPLGNALDWPHSTEGAREPIGRGHDQPPESTVLRQDIEWIWRSKWKISSKKDHVIWISKPFLND